MQKKIWGLAGLLSLCLLATPAEAAKLAEVEASLTGAGSAETVTLYGDQLAGGSNYYHNLLLMVTDRDGQLKTAFTPSLRGGYHPLLKIFTAAKHQEVLLAAAQGDADTDVAYRVVDFSQPGKVRETFSGIENFGVTTTAQYMDGRRFRVICHLEGMPKILDAATDDKDSLHVFDAEGKVQKKYLRPQVTNLVALTPVDGRLLSTQKIFDADGTTLLGQLYITWNREKETWVPQEVHLDVTDAGDESKLEKSKVNSSAAAGNWQLYSRSYVHQGVEVAYPEVAVTGAPEVQNKINDAIQSWLQEDKKNSQQAYRLEFAGPRLLSLIAFRQDGEGQITEKIFNFNMETGAEITFKEMFNYRDKDFLPLLNLIGQPKNSIKLLPRAWYYNGGTFVFILPEADLHGRRTGGSDRGYFEPTPAEKAQPEKLKRQAAAAKQQEVKLKQRAVPKAVFNPDGSFTKGQPLEVGVGAGYLVKFVNDKRLPASK
jgi:hypothetical protein